MTAMRLARSPEVEKADPPESSTPKVALAAGGVLAVLAMFCCGPLLLLVSLGLGGAWLSSSLELLTPLRPYLIGATLVVLGFAGWRIHRPAAACEAEGCALPKTKVQPMILFWMVAALVLAMLTFPYYGWLLV